MKGRKYSAAEIGAAAAFAVVLGISCFLGGRLGYGAGESNVAAETETEMAAQTRMIQDAAVMPEETAQMADVLILDGEQKEAAGEIMAALSQGKLAEAAAVMERREECLQELFYTTLNGERYLYDGESFRKEIEGPGMVFTKASTVYYGNFKNGKPDGQCMAFQAVALDAPRYDYSQGMWRNGRMEGDGHTGYCYYETSPRGEARDICKTGTFSSDLMEGDVTYISMNGEDGRSTWKFSVAKGVVVTDERWSYTESTGEYQLLSEDNDNHAYVLEEEQITQPMWQNLLVWDE